MAEAMNRTIVSVLMGGFGGEAPAPTGPGSETGGTVRSTSAADAAIQMAYARQVVGVPGYGMAGAPAQHRGRGLAKGREGQGVGGKFRLHPGAGRLPGPLNGLLGGAHA